MGSLLKPGTTEIQKIKKKKNTQPQLQNDLVPTKGRRMIRAKCNL